MLNLKLTRPREDFRQESPVLSLLLDLLSLWNSMEWGLWHQDRDGGNGRQGWTREKFKRTESGA